MRVFHAGRLESSLAGRGLDDPRRSLLCKFRGRSDRRYNRQTRALVVLVGATALPSAPGRTIFDLRPLLLGRMDPRGCRVLCPDFYLNYSRSALTLLVKAQRSGAFIALFCLKIFLDPETIFALTSIFSLYGSPAYFRAAKSDLFPGHVCRPLFLNGFSTLSVVALCLVARKNCALFFAVQKIVPTHSVFF